MVEHLLFRTEMSRRKSGQSVGESMDDSTNGLSPPKRLKSDGGSSNTKAQGICMTLVDIQVVRRGSSFLEV